MMDQDLDLQNYCSGQLRALIWGSGDHQEPELSLVGESEMKIKDGKASAPNQEWQWMRINSGIMIPRV